MHNIFDFRQPSTEEIPSAIELAWRTFLKFEAPDYSKQGIDSFYESIHNSEFISQLKFYGAFKKEKMIGVIATRKNGSHVALFFVEESYQGKGIGKRLFQMICKENQTGMITVNSSPYAVSIYKHLGFVPTDVEQITDGIRYTPMIVKGGV